MSHAAGIEIVIVGMAGLIRAVAECGLEYAESRQKLKLSDGSTEAVDLVVKDPEGTTVGVKVDPRTQVATLVPQDCTGTKGKALAGRIAQRYALSRVTEELQRKGYTLREEKLPDGTVRVVAQKWQ